MAAAAFRRWPTAKCWRKSGARCASTSVFVNAHHSIGIRALLLFGTHEQNQKWLPKLVTGEQLGAFALTEKEAGSDAANVQMQARPSEDGSHFILNGEKRYITNAAIAHELTVMARTPVPGIGQNCDHGVSGHARHAGIRDARGANAEDGNPRHGDRPFRVAGR